MRPHVEWICYDCAKKHGGESIPYHVATFHTNICGMCGEERTVTEPRDYNWSKSRMRRLEVQRSTSAENPAKPRKK